MKMSIFYSIYPEVPGGLGEETILDRSIHPPMVTFLHFKFDGWLGGDLITTFPCYLVSENLSKALCSGNLSGFEVTDKDLKITISEQFRELYPDRNIPKFYRLKIVGKAKENDFGLDEGNKLIISQRALDVLKKFSLSDSEIEEIK
jgi:hypothetical protein